MDNRLSEAAFVVGDDGTPAGLGFYGGDAEVFDGGVNEGSRAAIEVAEFVAGDAGAEGDVSFGHGA